MRLPWLKAWQEILPDWLQSPWSWRAGAQKNSRMVGWFLIISPAVAGFSTRSPLSTRVRDSRMLEEIRRADRGKP